MTGAEADSSVAKLTLATLKSLKSLAAFESPATEALVAPPKEQPPSVVNVKYEAPNGRTVGLNLSYTINLNLPATSDQAVFNAIFRSLKEHLLSDDS